MRKLIWPVLFLLCLSLQMSLPQNQWFKFDLPLLLIYCLAMLKGAFAGGIAGFFVGLLQDLLTGGIFGFHILTRTAIGYYVGYTKEKVFKDSMFYNIVAIVTITVALRGCYFILQVIMAKGFSVLLLELALQDTFAYCLGNIIFVIPLYLLTERLQKWIENWMMDCIKQRRSNCAEQKIRAPLGSYAGSSSMHIFNFARQNGLFAAL